MITKKIMSFAFALSVLILASTSFLSSTMALTEQEYLEKGQKLIGQGNALQLQGTRIREAANAQKVLSFNGEMTTIRIDVSGFDKDGHLVSGQLFLAQGDVGYEELRSSLTSGLVSYAKKLAE